MSFDDEISKLLSANQQIIAIGILDANGSILAQTDNWNLEGSNESILTAWDQGGSVSVQGINYVVLEAVPERLIATNVQGNGHIVAARYPVDNPKVYCVTYVDATAGPRDVIFDVQSAAQDLSGKI